MLTFGAAVNPFAADLDREWKRDDDGEPMRVERCLIDCGYMPNVVADFIRASPHAAILLASRGVGIGASGRPMHEYRRNRGDRLGAGEVEAEFAAEKHRGGIGERTRDAGKQRGQFQEPGHV